MNTHNLFRYSLITLIACLLFLPFLGHVHLFDWDEINFAECAREMIVSKDYLKVQVDFQPFWEKPPLFIWMQVLSMKLFGVNEYAARFPNAVMGIVTLISIYYIGKKVMNEKLASWWTILYVATWLPHFYFKSGIIDPTFNYFIFLAFFRMHLLRFGNDKFKHALAAGLFLGLAVLTKGPVAVLIAVVALLVYIFVNKGLWGYSLNYFLLIAIAAATPFALWFLACIVQNGWSYGVWFMQEFIIYQVRLFSTGDAGHGQPFYYHFIVLLIGCFPASIFLFQYNRSRTTDNEAARDFTKWMWILFWVTLLLFSIVKTKIVHYSSLCYFPLTYLAALKIYNLSERQERLKPGVKILLVVIGGLLALAIALLPVVGIHKDALIPYIQDPFAVANLTADVPWGYGEMIWGILYFGCICVSVILMKERFSKGILLLAISSAIIIQITVLHFTPKIEGYSQRAAIRYFKSFEGEDVYVHVLGYKSYAHLFYTQKQPQQNPSHYNERWLLTGTVDKPTYFICKVTSAAQYRAMPQLEEIGEQSGFVFFKRR